MVLHIIHHNFDDPLIVMGDIRMNGNPYIARDSTGRPINLSLHGQIIPSGARVYYTPPIGDDIFDPPKLNVEVYVNSFISQIQEPPSDVLVIAPGDMTGGVFVIDPDLIQLNHHLMMYSREQMEIIQLDFTKSGVIIIWKFKAMFL